MVKIQPSQQRTKRTYVEVSEFVARLGVGNNSEPVSKIVLLQVLFGEVLQIPENQKHQIKKRRNEQRYLIIQQFLRFIHSSTTSATLVRYFTDMSSFPQVKSKLMKCSPLGQGDL